MISWLMMLVQKRLDWCASKLNCTLHIFECPGESNSVPSWIHSSQSWKKPKIYLFKLLAEWNTWMGCNLNMLETESGLSPALRFSLTPSKEHLAKIFHLFPNCRCKGLTLAAYVSLRNLSEDIRGTVLTAIFARLKGLHLQSELHLRKITKAESNSLTVNFKLCSRDPTICESWAWTGDFSGVSFFNPISS